MKLLESDIKTKEILNWKGVHLLHFTGSSCSQKVRIFLNLKGINWVSHKIDLPAQKNYEPWFLGINPRGLVPVLVHDGEVHIESNDILIYLDEAFPATQLIPTDQREDMVSVLKDEDNLHLDLRNLTMRFVLPKFLVQKKPAAIASYENSSNTIQGNPDPHKEIELAYWNNYAKHGITDEQVRHSVKRFEKEYVRIEECLKRSRYITGNDITLLDIAWFIYTHRLKSVGYPFQRLHPMVSQWYQSLLEKPEFYKEIKSPLPLKLIATGLKSMQALQGTTLEKITGI